MADQHLQIRGGPGLQKFFFSALRAPFWFKNKEGGRAAPLDPPLLWAIEDVRINGPEVSV